MLRCTTSGCNAVKPRYIRCPDCLKEILEGAIHLCPTQANRPPQSLKDIVDTSVTNVRDHHVGKSNYSEHKIQPWDIWLEYSLNPWDADIVKRVVREKDDAGMTPTEQRILDYEKIKHVCDERIRQLKSGLK